MIMTGAGGTSIKRVNSESVLNLLEELKLEEDPLSKEQRMHDTEEELKQFDPVMAKTQLGCLRMDETMHGLLINPYNKTRARLSSLKRAYFLQLLLKIK